MENTAKTVFVCSLAQESNSFNPVPTKLERFLEYSLFEGGNPDSSISHPGARGMIDHLLSNGYTVKCGACMRSISGGAVDHAVVDFFLEKTLSKLKELDKVDGVCVCLHGATLSTKSDDVSGLVLETIRNIVGQNVPIAISADLHANITERVLQNADFVCGYQTYPHIDIYQTGVRAAKMLDAALSDNTFFTAAVKIPMIAPAHAYATTKDPLKQIIDFGLSLVEKGEIIDFSLFEVQPWLDVPEMHATAVVIAQTSEKAKEIALLLANKNFAIREELLGTPLFSVDEVIDIALKNDTDKPVILVDSSDSPNAGANADSAWVIEKLMPYCNELSCAVSVTDPFAANLAEKLGVGAVADFTLGATLAPELSKPVCVKNAKVVGVYDGIFTLTSSSTKCSIGKTAILSVGKMMIHVCSFAKQGGNLNFYKSFGINPKDFKLVAVKACTSFRAQYEDIASGIYNTQTPGAAGTNLKVLPYRRRPTPLYPFEEISLNDISQPTVYRNGVIK